MRATLSANAELEFGDKQWKEHYSQPSVDVDLAWKDILFDRHIAKLWEAKRLGYLAEESNLRTWGVSPPNKHYTDQLCITCGKEPAHMRDRCRICYGAYYRANLAHLRQARKPQ